MIFANVNLTVASILLVISLVFLLFGVVAYITLVVLQRKHSPEEVTKIILKRDVKNPVGAVNIISLVLIGVIIVGLALLLAAILTYRG